MNLMTRFSILDMFVYGIGGDSSFLRGKYNAHGC